MHDESHPHRTEDLKYPEKVCVFKRSAWYDGTLFESENELICIRPGQDLEIWGVVTGMVRKY